MGNPGPEASASAVGDVAETIPALLDRQVARFGERTLIQDEIRALTYREVGEQTDAIAGHLAALGVGHGTPVLLMLPNGVEFVLAWLGIAKAGGIVVPLNTDLFGDALATLLDQVPAPVFIVHTQYLPQLPPHALTNRTAVLVGGGGEGLQGGAGDSRQFAALTYGASRPDVTIGRDDPYQIMFSSGTTGRPRGVLRSYRTEMPKAALADDAKMTPEDVVIVCTPLYHGLGLNLVQMAIWAGASVVTRPRFSASTFWTQTRELGVTVMGHVGSLIHILMRAQPAPDDADNPVRLTFGVGVPADLWKAFETRFGVQVFEFYGSTETGLIALNPPPGRPGSVGKRFKHAELRLVGPDGKDVPAGEVGECYFRPADPNAPQITYFNDPEATAESIVDGWWRTGDLLREDADGYLYFAGRVKDTIRHRGKNIVPEDIERVIGQHPAVDECAAIAVPSDLGDDDVKICVVLSADRTVTPEELVRWCDGRLPAYMMPRYVEILPELPKTQTHKVQRNVLRARHDSARSWDREAAA